MSKVMNCPVTVQGPFAFVCRWSGSANIEQHSSTRAILVANAAVLMFTDSNEYTLYKYIHLGYVTLPQTKNVHLCPCYWDKSLVSQLHVSAFEISCIWDQLHLGSAAVCKTTCFCQHSLMIFCYVLYIYFFVKKIN